MNWEIVSGRWSQLKGGVKARWAELTDDDVGIVDGNRERLVGKLVERYGVLEGEAERQVEEWAKALASKFEHRANKRTH